MWIPYHEKNIFLAPKRLGKWFPKIWRIHWVWPPLPVTVTIRNFTCLGDLKLNLHFAVECWEGTTSNVFFIIFRVDVHGGDVKFQLKITSDHQKWRSWTLCSAIFGMCFLYISRIHADHIGEDSSISGTWNLHCYMGIIVNHEIRIPMKQPVFHGK